MYRNPGYILKHYPLPIAFPHWLMPGTARLGQATARLLILMSVKLTVQQKNLKSFAYFCSGAQLFLCRKIILLLILPVFHYPP